MSKSFIKWDHVTADGWTWRLSMMTHQTKEFHFNSFYKISSNTKKDVQEFPQLDVSRLEEINSAFQTLSKDF